jgi:osmotically inducible protein OsmC
MIRSAVAVWKGSPAAGEGAVSTTSGIMTNSLYSFGSSTGNEPCTSPSEMLAAAVASCMSLMLAQELAKVGIRNESVKTEAELTLDEKKGRWEISEISLHVSASLPESDAEKFHKATRTAKGRCPISRALQVPIKLKTTLDPSVHVMA